MRSRRAQIEFKAALEFARRHQMNLTGISNFMKSNCVLVLVFVFATAALGEGVLRCSGTVRYASGEPAAGVSVAYYPGFYEGSGDYSEVKTDTQGRYKIIQSEKPRGGLFWGHVNPTNSVMARDFEKNLAAIQEFDQVTTTIDLTLQPAITLTGSVKNTDGLPVNGAELELRFLSGDSLAMLEPRPRTDELGSFSIPALPQGRGYTIWGITAKGYGSSFARVEGKNTLTNRYEFPTFVLKPADHKLAGQVLDSDGKPVAGADVRFSGKGQPEDSKTKTDSEGNFVFDAVCEGAVQFSASAFSGGSPGKGVFMTSGGGAGDHAKGGDTNIVLRLVNRN